jgi:hypothetical protein
VLVSRLGGGELQESVSRILAVSDSPNPAPPPARWMAAVAAAARTLTAEEERMERACSTLLENNVDQSPAPGPFPPIPSEKEQQQEQDDDKPGSEDEAPRHDEEMEQVDVGGEVVSIEVPDSQGTAPNHFFPPGYRTRSSFYIPTLYNFSSRTLF